MKDKAVFLDRDGTINVDRGFVYRIEDFEFMDGAIEAIHLLNRNSFKVIVASNQSGIARGYYTEEDLKRLHRFINGELAKYGGWIDRFYYCPHHPQAKIEKYRANCRCRKPKAGLLERAIEDFDVNITQSYLVGDSLRDIEAGKAVGCRTILIAPELGAKKVDFSKEVANWVMPSLSSAVEHILELESEATVTEGGI